MAPIFQLSIFPVIAAALQSFIASFSVKSDKHFLLKSKRLIELNELRRPKIHPQTRPFGRSVYKRYISRECIIWARIAVRYQFDTAINQRDA